MSMYIYIYLLLSNRAMISANSLPQVTRFYPTYFTRSAHLHKVVHTKERKQIVFSE